MSFAHLAEKFLFLGICVRIMDKFNFFGRHTFLYEFRSDIIVYVKASVDCRCGKVAKQKLSRFFISVFIPYLVDIINAYVYLAPLIISKRRVYKTLVECGFSAVVCNEKHIVNRGIYHTVVYLLCSFRKRCHKLLLHITCRSFHYMVVCFGHRQL